MATTFNRSIEYEYISPINKEVIQLGKYIDRTSQLAGVCIKIEFFTYIFEHGAINTGEESHIHAKLSIYNIPDDPSLTFDTNDHSVKYALYSKSSLPIKLGNFCCEEEEFNDNWSYRDGPSKTRYFIFSYKKLTYDSLACVKKVKNMEEWDKMF